MAAATPIAPLLVSAFPSVAVSGSFPALFDSAPPGLALASVVTPLVDAAESARVVPE